MGFNMSPVRMLAFSFAVLTAPIGVQAEEIIKSHGISAFGDLKYPADFPHLDYVNPDAPKGGTFSTWAFGTFDSMKPYILKGNPARYSSIQFESLMSGTADEPDSIYGVLAESIEYPKSRQWAIFNIRPEAKFSDGTQVTADDVVFSYNILIEKGRPSFKTVLSDFETVEALDPLRVKFTFKEGSNTRELPLTAGGLPVFSKADFADKDFGESSMEPPIGSGEYMLERAVPGKTTVYKLRDDYWGAHLPINKGRSNFERLQFEYYADYTAAFEGFKGGAYSFREEFLSKLWATGYDFPALEKGWMKKEVLPDGNPSGTQGFWINMRQPQLSDPRVREAIGLMFNFEWSNKNLFYGIYKRTDSFWENSTLQAEGTPSAEELALLEPLKDHIPASVFTEPAFSPSISKVSEMDRGSLRKASKLLDDAGWAVGNDGKRRNDKGETLSLEFIEDSPSTDRIALPFISNLQKLGLDAKYTRIDAAQMERRQEAHDYGLLSGRFTMSLTPGIELRSLFSSKTADLKGSFNLSGVKNPAVDSLISTIEGAENREDLNVAVKALDRVLRALHIWVPNWYKGSHTVTYLDMYEYPENLPPYSMGTLDFWWYNAEKAEKLRAAGALK